MKKIIIAISAVLAFAATGVQAQWQPDVLGAGFEQMVINMPGDYEGDVNCALVRSLPDKPARKAVLYVHGFNDYFFQTEQAEEYNSHGYAFYAVDLRKYGRAHLPHQRRGNLRRIDEYFPDIDTCLNIIRAEGCDTLVLAGHSTGGLITSLYMDAHRNTPDIRALVLNSPFLDMNFGGFVEAIGVPFTSGLGAIMPGVKISSGKESFYARSIHRDFEGEWDYDLEWKPTPSVPVSLGWTRAIHKGHKKIRRGLGIDIPVLVMHSDKSARGKEWSEEFTRGDAVLDVHDIHRYAVYLGGNVTTEVITDGLHDLVLSRPDVRAEVYRTIFCWLAGQGL